MNQAIGDYQQKTKTLAWMLEKVYLELFSGFYYVAFLKIIFSHFCDIKLSILTDNNFVNFIVINYCRFKSKSKCWKLMLKSLSSEM